MPAWFALLLALAPGGLAWWRGRTLATAPEETLAERLFAYRRSVAKLAAIGTLLLVVLAASHLTWALPVLVLALLRGSFPARRMALQETWGFAAYASHMLRFGAAGAGFFILLAAAPALVATLGPASALPLAIVLVVWATGSRQVFLALARATPLDRPDLAPHFERVLGASRTAAPTLHRAGPRGGRMVNAFALPALPRSSVLFTDDLLDAFSPDEIGAVFAHEVAHLEHFDRKRVALRLLALLILVGLAAFAVPHVANRLPAVAWGPTIWALAVGIAVPLALAAHRGHEAESDRRAVALCGDPEALVRALVKLHALSALPRRFSVDVERGSSHPSLARRVQAIRRAAGAEPGSLPAPVVLPGEEAGRFVVLESERVHWLEGAPADRVDQPEALRLAATHVESSAYADLVDLHLDAAHRRVVLVTRTAAGQKRRLRLRPESASAAQAALDVVDVHLAPAPLAGGVPQALGSVTALCLVFVAILSGHPFSIGPAAAVGLWRMGPSALAVSGTVALAVAGLSSRAAPDRGGVSLLTLLAVGLAGAVGLLAAVALWRSAPAHRRRGSHLVLAVQAVPAAATVLGLVAAAAAGPAVLRLHQAASAPASVGALLGFGVALAFVQVGRRLAALPALAGALVGIVGSPWFAERFVPDPFLARAPGLRESKETVQPLAVHRFAGAAVEARLSPSGRAFAVRGWDDTDEEARLRFEAGAVGVEPRPIEALELRFVDEETALVLAPAGQGRLELRRVRLFAEVEPQWRIDVATLSLPSLEVAPSEGRWRLSGIEPGLRAARILTGDLGGGRAVEERFALPDGPAPRSSLSAGGRLALRRVVASPAEQAARIPLALLLATRVGFPLESEVFVLGPRAPRSLGTTGLEVQCVTPPLGEGPIPCLASDDVRTIVWELDPVAARLEARGTLPGRLTAVQAEGDAVLALGARLTPALVRPRAGSATWLEARPGGAAVLAPGGRALGVLRADGVGGTLAVFALPSAVASSPRRSGSGGEQ